MEIGEHDVEDDEVRRKFRGRLERAEAGRGGRHLEAHVAQGRPKEVGDGGLVIDDEDAGRIHGTSQRLEPYRNL